MNLSILIIIFIIYFNIFPKYLRHTPILINQLLFTIKLKDYFIGILINNFQKCIPFFKFNHSILCMQKIQFHLYFNINFFLFKKSK